MKEYGIKPMHGERVLVIGGLGFVGSNLAHKLLALGAEVTLYDACLDPYGWNLANVAEIKDKVRFVKGDTRDFELLKEHVRGKEHIFNLAAQVSHSLSMKEPFLDIEINCRGNMNVLEACRQVNDSAKIVYGGTRGQTGEALYLPVDEKHPDNPPDINGINKLAAEKYHLLYFKVYGIPATSLRIGNTYGPRHQMKHGEYGVLNYFIRRAMLGEVIEVYGSGNQIRDYTYVDDLVDALLLLAQSNKASGEVFLIGSGEQIKFLDMVKLVIKTVERGEYRLIPFPPGRKEINVERFAVSYKKLNKTVGWRPKTKLKEGMRKTVDFYRTRLKEYI